MDQERMEQLAKRLGEGAERRIDAPTTARAVLQRLEAEPETGAWSRARGGLRAAAVLAILVSGALVVRSVVREPVGAEVAVLPTPVELRELAIADLAEVLDSLDFYRPVSELVPATLHDLNEQELRQLLQWIEG